MNVEEEQSAEASDHESAEDEGEDASEGDAEDSGGSEGHSDLDSDGESEGDSERPEEQQRASGNVSPGGSGEAASTELPYVFAGDGRPGSQSSDHVQRGHKSASQGPGHSCSAPEHLTQNRLSLSRARREKPSGSHTQSYGALWLKVISREDRLAGEAGLRDSGLQSVGVSGGDTALLAQLLPA